MARASAWMTRECRLALFADDTKLVAAKIRDEPIPACREVETAMRVGRVLPVCVGPSGLVDGTDVARLAKESITSNIVDQDSTA
jgi:hypothetical protein